VVINYQSHQVKWLYFSISSNPQIKTDGYSGT